MSWSDKDRISFKDLQEDLQDLINSKVSSDAFAQSNRTIDSHITNEEIHVTQSDKDTWNQMLAAAKTYAAALVKNTQTIIKTDITTVSDDMKVHMADNVIHITKGDRDKWDAMYDNSKEYTDNIKKELQQSIGENTTKTDTSINDHINNMNIHVSVDDRVKWDSVYDQSVKYTNKVKAELEKSINSTGKNADSVLNTHVNNKDVHVTLEDKGRWDGSVNTANAYTDSKLAGLKDSLSTTDRNNYNALLARIHTLEGIVNGLKADTLKDAKAYTDSKVGSVNTVITEHINTPVMRVNGVRVTVGSQTPNNPVNDKELFFNTSNRVIYAYTANAWQYAYALYR